MAQETDAQLQARRAIIENETATHANTTTRVGDMIENIIDSKINNDRVDTADTLDTAGKDIADKDAIKAYIAANGGGGGHVIEDEGTPLTQRTKLNFVGAGVTVTDDSGDDASVVTIPDGGSGKLDSLVSLLTFTASHTLDSTDLAAVNAGDQLVIRQNSGSANNLEIPLNATVAFPVGTVIGVRNINTGVVTITAVVGVTLTSPLSYFNLANQWDMCYIEKTATNTWVANGQLSA